MAWKAAYVNPSIDQEQGKGQEEGAGGYVRIFLVARHWFPQKPHIVSHACGNRQY